MSVIADHLNVHLDHWRPDAACGGENPDFWDPSSYARFASPIRVQQYAKSICASCPVRDACLAEAVRTNAHGIWGGTTEQERDAERRGLRGAV